MDRPLIPNDRPLIPRQKQGIPAYGLNAYSNFLESTVDHRLENLFQLRHGSQKDFSAHAGNGATAYRLISFPKKTQLRFGYCPQTFTVCKGKITKSTFHIYFVVIIRLLTSGSRAVSKLHSPNPDKSPRSRKLQSTFLASPKDTEPV